MIAPYLIAWLLMTYELWFEKDYGTVTKGFIQRMATRWKDLGFDEQFYYSKGNLYNGQGVKQKLVLKELSTWRAEKQLP